MRGKWIYRLFNLLKSRDTVGDVHECTNVMSAGTVFGGQRLRKKAVDTFWGLKLVSLYLPIHQGFSIY